MTYHARQMLHSILTPKRNNPARVTRAGTPGFQAVLLVSLLCTHQLGAGHLVIFFLSHALKGDEIEKKGHAGDCHYEPRTRAHNDICLDTYGNGVCRCCCPSGGDTTPPRRPWKGLPHGVHDKPRKGQGEDEQENNENGKHFYRPLSVFYEVPAFGTSSP